MKLIEYLVEKDLRPAAFARLIKVKSDMTVIRYIRGERIPAPDIMRRIESITGGIVTRADFLDKPSPANDDIEHEWSRLADYEEKRVKGLMKAMLKKPKEGEILSPPLRRAVDTLKERGLPLIYYPIVNPKTD